MKQKQFETTKSLRFKMFGRRSYSAFASIGKTVSIGFMTGCTLSFMSGSVHAQDGQKPVELAVKELNEIMVTAALIETPLEEVTKSITFITKQEIQKAPIYSINDLLQYVASIDVIQRGGHGVQTDISLRGSSQDQVAVLLNGINLSNAQTGHFALDLPINTSDIERIEILYGPSALVYGSFAFSGGINIITKKNIHEKILAKVEAGMHNFKSIESRAATQIGTTSNSLSVGYRESDGYIKNSDYNIFNLFWQTRLNVKKNNTVDLQLGYNDKKFGANTFYTPAYPNQYEKTRVYLGTLSGEFGNQVKCKPIIYWTRHYDQFDLERNSTKGRNSHRTDTYGANLTLSYQSKIGITSITSELRKDEIMSTKLGIPMVKPHHIYPMYDARTNIGAGIEHSIKIERFAFYAGILTSINSLEREKIHFSPSISGNYSPSQSIKIYSSWSRSTRMPTFTDMYYTTETHLADETIVSEESESWELGLKYRNDFMSAYIIGFISWGKNIIDWIKENPEDLKWKSWNHSKLNTQGVELGAKFNLSTVLPILNKETYFKVDYSHLAQDMDALGMTSLYSLNYLKDKVVMNLNYNIYRELSIGWFFRFQNRNGNYIQYKNLKPVGKEKYHSYTTLDLKINYKIENINIHLNFNNIGNTNYYDLGNIPQAGFWLIGGLSYSI